MIARPARVRIRSRKPGVLDRRRVVGRNVRLLTRSPHYTTSAAACPPADEHARGAGGRGASRTRWPPEAGSCGDDPENRQDLRRSPGAQQTPTSITEDRRPPAAGRFPTPQAAPPAPTVARGTP